MCGVGILTIKPNAALHPCNLPGSFSNLFINPSPLGVPPSPTPFSSLASFLVSANFLCFFTDPAVIMFIKIPGSQDHRIHSFIGPENRAHCSVSSLCPVSKCLPSELIAYWGGTGICTWTFRLTKALTSCTRKKMGLQCPRRSNLGTHDWQDCKGWEKTPVVLRYIPVDRCQ